MSKKAPVLLVLMGSFNPPHFRHMRLLEMAKDHLQKLSFNVVGGRVGVFSNLVMYCNINLGLVRLGQYHCHACMFQNGHGKNVNKIAKMDKIKMRKNKPISTPNM